MGLQARNTSKITDCRKTMINRFRACSLLRLKRADGETVWQTVSRG